MEYTPVPVDVLSSFEGAGTNHSLQPPGRNTFISLFDNMPDTDYHTLADMENWNVFILICFPTRSSSHRKNGKITVRLSSLTKEDTRWIRFTVANTGSMISAEHIRSIFDRFYKIDMHHAGSGIGLALVKAFVELHKGQFLWKVMKSRAQSLYG